MLDNSNIDDDDSNDGASVKVVRVSGVRLLVPVWTVELTVEPLKKPDGDSDELRNDVVVIASELSELFGEVEPVIIEEVGVVVDTMELDFPELKEAQLGDEVMDEDIKELEKNTSVGDGAVSDDSKKIEDWEITLDGEFEEKAVVLTKDDDISDEATDSDVDEPGTSEEVSKYKELISEGIDEEETA